MIVLFVNNSALSLSHIERDEQGAIKRAYVNNGWWWLVIKKGEMLAKSGAIIVTRQPIVTLEEVEIEGTGDYNEDIARAGKKRKQL